MSHGLRTHLRHVNFFPNLYELHLLLVGLFLLQFYQLVIPFLLLLDKSRAERVQYVAHLLTLLESRSRGNVGEVLGTPLWPLLLSRTQTRLWIKESLGL